MKTFFQTLSAAIHVFFGFGPCCRFAPSCSEFADAAMARHGIFRGSWFVVGRLLKCHPWGGSGWDPVPQVDKG